jgi:hypothetical protein
MPEFEATASKSPSQRLVTAKQLTHFHLDSSAWHGFSVNKSKPAVGH